MSEREDIKGEELQAAETPAAPVPSTPSLPSAPPASPREALTVAAVVTLSTAAVVTYAFSLERAGKPSMLVAMGALYAVLAAAGLYRLRARGELRAQMMPRGGDLTRGAFTAALLYGMAMAVHLTITGRGSPREGWIMRLYLQLGDPDAEGRVFVGGAVFAIAALEEIVWRGLVMRALEGPLTLQRAWLVSTLLFAAAHLPTCFLLADPVAGPNPMLVMAALGCGLVWGYIVAIRSQRLVPAIFAHALFTWAVVEFPIWRP